MLLGKLDYENTTTYSVFVEVVDQHQEKSTLSITLTVTDVNEKPTSIIYKDLVPVPEGSPQNSLVGPIVVRFLISGT